MAVPAAGPGADVYAWAHNETSTGAIAPVRRVEGADDGALVVVDGTSAAGGADLDVSQTDVYYFAPQKSFGSEGGLWFALLSPPRVERVGRIAASDRWIPESLSLDRAVPNSRLDQTLNTPAVATLFLMRDQLRWLLDRGGLPARPRAPPTPRAGSTRGPSSRRTRPRSSPTRPTAHRSSRPSTSRVSTRPRRAALRANGVVDTEPYRKLGRNQLRVGMFPNVDPDDVSPLCACIDWLIERL